MSASGDSLESVVECREQVPLILPGPRLAPLSAEGTARRASVHERRRKSFLENIAENARALACAGMRGEARRGYFNVSTQ